MPDYMCVCPCNTAYSASLFVRCIHLLCSHVYSCVLLLLLTHNNPKDRLPTAGRLLILQPIGGNEEKESEKKKGQHSIPCLTHNPV
jgi:hypothetical protein